MNLVMGVKESMDCMGKWVLYTHSESWNMISKTIDVLCGD